MKVKTTGISKRRLSNGKTYQDVEFSIYNEHDFFFKENLWNYVLFVACIEEIEEIVIEVS